jgi:hypothetical protein
MERIRKGNDINITWEIYTSDGVNEYPYSLIGKNIEVIIKNAFTEIPVYNYSIDGNVIRFTFGGKSQDHVGLHTITLIENNGLPGMHTVDECNAFILVSHSCQTGGDQEEEIECVNLKFKGSIEIGNPDSGGSGGSVNRIDFEVRTVYPTKQTVLEEETFDITEEERAYNIETLSETLSGKTVFCKVGEAILFPTISMSGVVTEATYSTVVVLGGSLASYSLTITSNGDAEVVIADVTTGGGSIDPALLEGYMPMMREFSDDFNDDFAR